MDDGAQDVSPQVDVIHMVTEPIYLILNQLLGVVEVHTVKSGLIVDCRAL